VTSHEVLAPPPPRRHPLLAAVAGVAALGLVAWGVAAQLTGDDGPPPGTAPPPSAAPYVVPTAPPPWVTHPREAGRQDTAYGSTPLDGHWVTGRLSPAESRAIAGTRPRERLTLLFRGTALVVWVGTPAEPEQRMLGYEAVYVEGHSVQVSPVGASDERAHYRWRIDGDVLRFRLLDRTRGASASERLVSVPFDRSLWS
jgi:hypothetical protein